MTAKQKLFVGPVVAYAVFITPVVLFFTFARYMLGWKDPGWLTAEVITVGVAMLAGTVCAAVCLWDDPGWYNLYREEKRVLDEKREKR